MGVQHTTPKEVSKEVEEVSQAMASGAGKVVEEPEEVGRETRSRSRNNLKDSSVTDDRSSRKETKVGLGVDAKVDHGCGGKDQGSSNKLEMDSTVTMPNSGIDKKKGAYPKNKDVSKVGKVERNIQGAMGRGLVDAQCSTGSHTDHTHVECSNRNFNEWIVSKDFNLNHFSNEEIK